MPVPGRPEGFSGVDRDRLPPKTQALGPIMLTYGQITIMVSLEDVWRLSQAIAGNKGTNLKAGTKPEAGT